MIAELLAGISGAGLLASIGSTIYFAVKHARAVEHAASVQVAQAHSEGEQTRLVFENETLQTALAESKRRNSLLAEALSAEINRNPNADLPADDVASRLRRLEVSWSTDGVPAVQPGALPDESAAATADAGELPVQPATELR